MMVRKDKVFPVTVYFSKDEYAQVRRVAKQAGLSLSDVVRMCTKYVINEVLIAQSFVSVMAKATEREVRER